MHIRKAEAHELDSVQSFYHELIDTAVYTPMWEKDIFPDRDDLSAAINQGGLFIGIRDSKIVASVSICEDDGITCLNLLGVLPSYSRRGFARQMVSFVISRAQSIGHNAVHLHVLDGNIAAERLYTSMGFKHIGGFEEYYERTGLMVFKTYAYSI